MAINNLVAPGYRMPNANDVPIVIKKTVGKPIVSQVGLYNIAAKQINDKFVSKINNMPQYKNADLTKDSALRSQYYKAFADTFAAEINKAAKNSSGSNPSLTYSVDIIGGATPLPGFQINQVDMKHTGSTCKVIIKRDDKGFITLLSVVETSLVQSAISTQEYLEHHGIVGMKWGRSKTHSKSAIQAKQDHKDLSKMSGRGNTKAKRELKNNIATRSNNPKYAKEFQKNIDRKAKNDKIISNVKKAAFGLALLAIYTGSPKMSSSTSKGANYVKSNPGLMNAKVISKGVFKVTNMK